MPYHRLGQNKYDYLGRDYALNEMKPSSKSHIDQLKEAVEACGLKCSIGGV